VVAEEVKTAGAKYSKRGRFQAGVQDFPGERPLWHDYRTEATGCRYGYSGVGRFGSGK
jgi:hypothetical protein